MPATTMVLFALLELTHGVTVRQLGSSVTMHLKMGRATRNATKRSVSLMALTALHLKKCAGILVILCILISEPKE